MDDWTCNLCCRKSEKMKYAPREEEISYRKFWITINRSFCVQLSHPPWPHPRAMWPSPSPRRKGYFRMSDTTQSHTEKVHQKFSLKKGGGGNAIDKGISRSHRGKKTTSTEITFPVISGEIFTVIIRSIASTILLVRREGEEAGNFPAVFTPSGNSYKTTRPGFFFFFFYGSRVDLQCCVNLCCTAKWFSYTYISFFIFSFIMAYHRILNIVPCAMLQDLTVHPFYI